MSQVKVTRIAELEMLEVNAHDRLAEIQPESWKWGWFTSCSLLYVFLALILPSTGLLILAGLSAVVSSVKFFDHFQAKRLFERALYELRLRLDEHELTGVVHQVRPCGSEIW